jgi:transposase
MKKIIQNSSVNNAEVSNKKNAPNLKIGLDVHLEWIVAVVQEGNQTPKAPRRFKRAELVDQIRKWKEVGHEIWCVQESCGFGFVLHRELEAAGATSFVITPIVLAENGKRRKTDKLDARYLCSRLSRYVEGNKTELAPIRIPSEAEQRRREVSRRREFIQKEMRRIDNRGRALLLEHCHETLPSGWWGPRKWKWNCEALDPYLKSILESLRELLLKFREQHRALTAELEKRVEGELIPKALGALTISILDNEICDWHRFKNRKQMGSYTGCCPSEYSSGGKQVFGSIDRCGNHRVRKQLVEAVWRLLRYQSKWHALKKHMKRLGDSVAQRKKVIVALARQLAIDLWRWRTGRCTLQDLGLETVPATLS